MGQRKKVTVVTFFRCLTVTMTSDENLLMSFILNTMPKARVKSRTSSSAHEYTRLAKDRHKSSNRKRQDDVYGKR